MTRRVTSFDVGAIELANGTTRPFTLPESMVTESIMVVGNKGSGKTYGAKVVVEEMLRAGHQVVIIDPTDVWWGLRYAPDRGGNGLAVYVFGGAHADLPINAESGALVADTVVDTGASVIVCTRGMTLGAGRKFVTDFCNRLYERKADPDLRTPVMVVIDEAHKYAPQNTGSGNAENATLCLGAVTTVALEGRSSGIGIMFVTQRVAGIAKSVLEVSEVLFAFRTGGANSRKALNAWIVEHQADEDEAARFHASLSALARGTCWLWSPGELDLFALLNVRTAVTFDSSATPKAGRRPKPRGKAMALDLGALETAMKAVVETAAANDPVKLRAEIASLRRDLDAWRGHECAPAAPQIVEVPKIPVEALGALLNEKGAAYTETVEAAVKALRESLVGTSLTMFDEVRAALPTLNIGEPVPVATPTPAPARHTPGVGPSGVATVPLTTRDHIAEIKAQRDAAAPVPVPTGGYQLRAGARRMLDAVAQIDNGQGANESAVRALARAGKGKTFGTYKSNLVTAGLVTIDGGRLFITEAGRDFTGHRAPVPVTRDEVLAHWRRHGGLRAGARQMLDIVADAGPAGIHRHALQERVGIESDKTFGTYLSNLTATEIVVIRQGVVALVDELA